MKLIITGTLIILISILAIAAYHMPSSNQIEVGSKIPDFSLLDQKGNIFHSSEIIGKQNLVVYFYPKDNTRGCTKEACTFRDSYQDFIDAGAEVIGISSDQPVTHSEFAKTHKLPFILLCDENEKVRKLFGVESDLFGLIPGRVTYIIDKKGIVRYKFKSQTQVEKHVSESLRIIRSLN
jgi:thioredoxin-dependent peroxiredoxin